MLSQAIRNDFKQRSTGSRGRCGRVGCYLTKQHAIHEFDKALHYHNLYLVKGELFDCSIDNGHATLPIWDMAGNQVDYAIVRWHKMPSGTYNFIGWIALMEAVK